MGTVTADEILGIERYRRLLFLVLANHIDGVFLVGRVAQKRRAASHFDASLSHVCDKDVFDHALMYKKDERIFDIDLGRIMDFPSGSVQRLRWSCSLEEVNIATLEHKQYPVAEPKSICRRPSPLSQGENQLVSIDERSRSS
jgi:hypothetical protein